MGDKMGIIKKFNDLVRSNLNDWLDKAEDPKKLRAQKIIDVEASKHKAHRLLLSAMASLKLAQKKQQTLKNQIIELSSKAENSLINKDKLSDESLIKDRQILENRYEELAHLIKEEQQSIDTINRGLKALDDKIRRLKRSPEASLRIRNTTLIPPAESPDHVNDTRLFDNFDRMEEKIDTNEAEVAALTELMAYMEQNKNIEDEPKKTESTNTPSLEDELSDLKKKLSKD
jgi:phage shock protein A